MVRLASYAILFSGITTSWAAGIPARRAMAVHEQRELPAYFTSAGAPSPDTPINLKIALTASDRDGLEQTLWDVSTPGSALYGQHLSFEEAKAFAAPSTASVSAVTEWLNENGITDITTSGAFGEWLGFSTTISSANSLFDADFQKFTEINGPTQLTRTLAYSLPADLQQHINLLHPATDFVRKINAGPKFRAFKSTNNTARALTAPSSCNTVVTPTCLQDLYGIPKTPATQASNKLGVSGFIDQWPQTADLKSFLTSLRPDISSTTTFALTTLDGGSDPQAARDAGIEADLDVQYTVGVATKVPVTFFSVGENNNDGDLGGFLDIMNTINAETAPPQVSAYDFFPVNFCSVSHSLHSQLCDAYMTAGARGVSILFASGDGGVSGSQSASCTTFVPTFPSGCQFLTSVGATQDVAETAASFSSGGFSNFFTQPSYQTTAVAAYLKALGSTNSGKFTPTGRAYPDVSAQGVDVEIFSGGEEGTVDGTSCASPIFTSVIALINDRLIAAGALFDITTGDNPGCNTNGFPAKTGWDPVTGLGTPNFASLLAAALAA
ncbi:family S53 protease [Gymnopus androsaceus JB14]|uniref:tripeptidyl-peptidase II n=1 Tax=Gymnopus androsaceus JB14 TaxID=1447944 RepID=A0A6A4GJQ0_9AGAR|nr:family S53 protease [Gymnopus androsaceus JB14]